MNLAISSEKLGSLEVITYVVACPETSEALLIDPGAPSPALLARLQADNLRLRWIVNTHGHADHTAGNDFFTQHTRAQVVMHRLDAAFFQQPAMQAEAQAGGFPPLSRVDLRVEDGQALPLGRHQAIVLHTPGHTPGAICLHFPGHLFTGDTLFVEAAGRTDLPGGSLEMLIHSLETKIMPLPDDTTIWPGHDYGDTYPTTLAQEKENNPFLTDFF